MSKKPEPVYATQEGYTRLLAEYRELTEVKRHEIAQRIQHAREMGSLDDNAEYDSAREEKLIVENRISEIEDILKRIKIIEDNNVQKRTEIVVGSMVVVEVEGEKDEFTIVGSVEADPAKGYISNESPVGKSLLGHKKGDKVAVETEVLSVSYKIIDIQ